MNLIGGLFSRLLSHPAWQGVGAVIAAISLIVAVLALSQNRSPQPQPHARDPYELGPQVEAHVRIDGAVHNSTIVAGSANEVTIENIAGVSPEQFQELAEELGVKEAALKSFFEVLEQDDVARDGLDSALRKIATRYKELDKKEREAVENGDLGSTRKLVGLVSQHFKVPAVNNNNPVGGKLRLNVTENGEKHMPRGLYETD